MSEEVCTWSYEGNLMWFMECGSHYVEDEKGEVDDFLYCPNCGEEVVTLRPVSYYDGMDDAE